MPQPNGVAGNAQHRTQGSEPPEDMRPPGIFVVQVLDRRPLHDVEEEHALNYSQS